MGSVRLQESGIMSAEKVIKQYRKMPSWKASGKDCVQGYWIKNLSNLHERIAYQMNKILMGEDTPPEWMTYGRTVLCQKDLKKGNAAKNYRPIGHFRIIFDLFFRASPGAHLFI